MTKPFTQSGYERRAGDHYPTIDARCVDALALAVPLSGRIIDPCAPNGSGIVQRLRERGYDAEPAADAFAPLSGASWIVTNPPYARAIVDDIVTAQVARLERGEVIGVACLMRALWDFATNAKRRAMLDSMLYCGQVRLLFRPWWTEERKRRPIHSYCWHVWTVKGEIAGARALAGAPLVLYSQPMKEPKRERTE